MVFDCGDTLLELRPSRYAICAGVLERLGRPVPEERIRMAYRVADSVLKQRSSAIDTPAQKGAFFREFNTLLSRALGIETLAAQLDEALQQAFADKRHWAAIEGAPQALERFAAKVPLYVLANWDHRLREHLERSDLAKHFRGIFGSRELGAEKPDPRIFEAFRRRSGVDPSAALYVGNDYEADVMGSREAGFVPVLLDREGLRGPEVDCLYCTDWASLTRAMGDVL